MTAHWGMPDPAAVREAAAQECAFRDAFFRLDRRISLFLRLPIKSLDDLVLQDRLKDIGRK